MHFPAREKFIKMKTPFYVIDEALLEKNLETLQSVEKSTGCKILLAQKCYSIFQTYPKIAEYISGTTASGIFEARLGYEEMGKPFGKQTHVFAPAYTDEDMDELVKICDHIIFNSAAQWEQHKAKCRGVSCGIRINPEYSEVEHGIYNPCGEGSRLGVRLCDFEKADWSGIEGIHFHTLCEQNSDALRHTLDVVTEKFGKYIKNLKWVNFGGGHHITRSDYDIELLKSCINDVKNRFGVEVYVEPGEAVALNAGFLESTVLDITENGVKNAILDASAACHMPDVIEMPYRPPVVGGFEPDEKPYTYRFGGNTCLAGDIIGDYSFEKPLQVGSRVVFADMAIYSMVKNNTFNGIPLPSIYLRKKNGEYILLREFTYNDFKSRL